MNSETQFIIQIILIPIITVFLSTFLSSRKERIKEKDTNTYNSLLEKFPEDSDFINYLENYDLGGIIKRKIPIKNEKIKLFLNNHNSVFLTKRIENKRLLLLEKAIEFSDFLQPNLFPRVADNFDLKFRKEAESGDSCQEKILGIEKFGKQS